MDKIGHAKLTEAVRERYHESTKSEKSKILDEFVAITGFHRKYALRVLRKVDLTRTITTTVAHKKIYDEAVKEAIVVLWEASDRICGKRLKSIIPVLLESLERHQRLTLDATVREKVLAVSASTIDRLLRSVRSHSGSKKRRRVVRKTRAKVAIKTFADWEDTVPGNLEMDFVAHCGGSLKGSFIHSLVVTDVCSGWTEATPLLMREQAMVVEGLEVIRGRLPMPLLGINSDNDSAFINETVINYCSEKAITFTRSRPYRKNDQAWIEQKNGAVIRSFLGYSRFSGQIAGQTMAHLYGNIRLFVNYFQPSFKLLDKWRDGSKVRKTYSPPMTPCDRLLTHPGIDERRKKNLRIERASLDPMSLLHRIRQAQSALASLASPGEVTDVQEHDLDKFLAQLPRLWQQGEVRPTHRKAPPNARDYRTRKDPFEGAWPQVLTWLEKEPDATAKTLFQRLQKEQQGKYSDGQLRTLQRRVRQWRHIMAKQLIYSSSASEQLQPQVADERPVG